jgi:LysR family transcriptional regulator, glycine cleavage system transcriptional activator
MARALPPLIALRAFDSAARHNSFVLAADELNLTPGAISHQVKQLEAWIGRPLFVRRSSGVSLNEAGKAFSERLANILNQIAQAAEQAKNPETRLKVVIRCQHSTTAKWLLEPALAFSRSYPEIELVIRSENYSHDPFVNEADIAIYYSRGPIPGVLQDPFLKGAFRIVAAPALLAASPERLEPGDFLHLPLIHVTPIDRGWSHPDWATWFDAAGISVTEPLRGFTVSLFHIGVDACVAGAGFALLDDIFARTALEKGELVQCSPIVIPSPHAHCLMVRETSLDREEVKLARDWLMDWARTVQFRGGAGELSGA